MKGVTDQLIIKKKGGIGIIQFNNQQHRNALTYEMWQGLPIILEEFRSDQEVRVVVLSGSGGKAFCAGADISQFEKNRSSKDSIASYDRAVDLASDTLSEFPKPTVAKIEGSPHNLVAVINFATNGERKIMLNYAKLRIID